MYLVGVFVKTKDESKYDKGHTVNATEESVKDEEKKIFVVSNTDAVVDPGAVVIHFDDASFANTVKND